MKTTQIISELNSTGCYECAWGGNQPTECECPCCDYKEAVIEAVDKLEKTRWIPCTERLPEVETQVLVLATRKYSGTSKKIIATALYEDGTVLENDSVWSWHDLDGEYNDEEDCYYIPEGWFEFHNYQECEYDCNAIDDFVTHWMPLPEPYKGEKE